MMKENTTAQHCLPLRTAAARVLVFLLLMLSTCLPAQSPWQFSVGMPWREFGKIRLAPGDMTPDAPGHERFLDGQVVAMGEGLYAYTVADSLSQVDVSGLDRITYTDLIGSACSCDLGDAPGIDIEIRRELLRSGSWRVELSASFRWLGLDQSTDGTGSLLTRQYSIAPNCWPSPNPPGGGPDPDTTTAYFKVHDPLQISTTPTTGVSIRHRIDLDLYELSLGGFAAWEHGPVQLGFGLAPVLALPRLRLRSTSSLPSVTMRDTADDALLGLRVSAELRWEFSTPFFLAISAEYECFTDSLEGDLLVADLDGPALRAAIGCRF